MQKVLIYLLIILFPILGYSQSAEDDEITYGNAIEWLDRKLNYIYYDDVSEKWWLNKFYVNEKKEITIKNIHTDKPRSANIKEKVYLIRKVKVQDINPYQIEVRDVKQSSGRMVKGKMLALKTFANKKSVVKTVDGRRGSPVSFLHISFPTFMLDSIADYPELVRSKLKEAIIATTKIYATGNPEEDIKNIFKIMRGSFSTEDGQQMQVKKKFENVLMLKINEQSENYFGYTPKDETFYFESISSEGVVLNNYKLLSGPTLALQNINEPSDLIEFETWNSVRIGGTVYYRN